MSKQYKLVVHFIDGQTWDTNELGIVSTSEQLKFTLDEFQKSEDMEITSMLTDEKRKVSEIKSIELLF